MIMTMSFSAILPVNIPEIISALGPVIMVVAMLVAVRARAPAKISQVIFTLGFEIVAVNLIPDLLVGIMIAGRFPDLRSSGSVGAA